MVSFRSPASHAGHVMKSLQGDTLRSVGTVRNYEQALTRVAEWAQQERVEGGLKGMTPELAVSYLEQRGLDVGQKTLDMERQAVQCMMQNVTGTLAPGERLPIVKAETQQILEARAYTPLQAALIAAAQFLRDGPATEIAHAAGLCTPRAVVMNGLPISGLPWTFLMIRRPPRSTPSRAKGGWCGRY